jgi:hypothetical protein
METGKPPHDIDLLIINKEMKSFLTTLLLISGLSSFAQSAPEKELLSLSNCIFNWEVNGKIDSLKQIFNDRFVVVSAAGESQTKEQYLERLKSGNFVHNSIVVLKNSAIISDYTATVFGDGVFTVTVNGNKITLRLSYMEVFTRADYSKPWTILAIHASNLSDNHK